MLVCKLTNVFHFSFSKLKQADISLRVFDLKQKRFICIRRNLLEKLYFWNLEKWFQTISWLHKLCKNKTHHPGLSITLRRFFFILYRSTRLNDLICVMFIYIYDKRVDWQVLSCFSFIFASNRASLTLYMDFVGNYFSTNSDCNGYGQMPCHSLTRPMARAIKLISTSSQFLTLYLYMLQNFDEYLFIFQHFLAILHFMTPTRKWLSLNNSG